MDRPLELNVVRGDRIRRATKVVLPAAMLVPLLLLLPGWMRPSRESGFVQAVANVGPIDAVITASGVVVPEIERVVSSPLDARVLRILKHPGAALKQGEAVVELDVSQSVLVFEKVVKDSKVKDNQQAQARLTLENTLRELEGRIELKTVEWQSAQTKLGSQRQLFEAGLVSRDALRQSELEEKQTQVALTQLEADRRNTQRSTELQLEGLDLERASLDMADGGTIFLDEIGNLDQASQVKMLRVLQDRSFEVLGSSQRREVDVRVVSATNRSLADLVGRGEFREDLLYRINLIAVHLPALRERPDDIAMLANHFLQTVAQVYRRERLSLGSGTRRWLEAQPWPGNVRQLRQAIERAVLVSARDVLEVDDFRDTLMDATDAVDPLPAVGSMTMDEIERAMIVKSLKHHGGNVSKVAESLGLSRAALYRRFERYGITV